METFALWEGLLLVCSPWEPRSHTAEANEPCRWRGHRPQLNPEAELPPMWMKASCKWVLQVQVSRPDSCPWSRNDLPSLSPAQISEL
ncbi:unnamed protein product [Gulo gulo]|uniref:Uncharacterized protein n=1 Tax=Gulo gulo TaxID=48420 RepID=A0A9X9MCT2_GULGU|nr:unnamed protein product [Gulo gulo]